MEDVRRASSQTPKVALEVAARVWQPRLFAAHFQRTRFKAEAINFRFGDIGHWYCRIHTRGGDLRPDKLSNLSALNQYWILSFDQGNLGGTDPERKPDRTFSLHARSGRVVYAAAQYEICL